MTIEVPDLPATERFSPDELRLELACALFAQRKVSSITGSRMAGVDLFTFQRALGERQIEIVTLEQFEEDVKTLERLFPS